MGREDGGNQEGLKGLKKVLKNHICCQSKSLWMKKPSDVVNSGENVLDKKPVRAKSVPQSDPINRTTCRNH